MFSVVEEISKILLGGSMENNLNFLIILKILNLNAKSIKSSNQAQNDISLENRMIFKQVMSKGSVEDHM